MNPQIAHTFGDEHRELRLYPAAKAGQYFLTNYSLKALRKRRKKFEILKSFAQSEVPVELAYPTQYRFFAPPAADAVEEVLAYAMAKRKGRKKSQVLYLGRRDLVNGHNFMLDRPGGRRHYQWEISPQRKKITDIRDLFPKIVARIRDADTKVILSFGSGGIRLFAHPSLMKFIELLSLRKNIDEIWGCSGGAIAGLPYSIGVPPEVIEEEGYHLYNERYSFRLSPSKFQVLKNLLAGSIWPSSKEMVKGFMDCQNGIKALLEKHIKRRKADIPFYCVAYNLKRSRNEVLTPGPVPSLDYEIPIVQTNALDAVVASSSIPILYVPKLILRGKSKHHYVDGATTEEVPLLSPYQKWVQDRHFGLEKRKKLLIISVNLFPKVSDSKIFTNFLIQRIPALRLLQLSANFADLIRQARIDEHKKHLERDSFVTHWELNFPDSGVGIVDTRGIPKVIEVAQKTFFGQMREIEKSLRGRP